MIKTLSICSTCYKRIPANIIIKEGAAYIVKTCPVHGEQEALIDPDASIVIDNHNTGTEGHNKAVLVPITDKCNLSCSWCYTSGIKTEEKSAKYYDSLLIDLKKQGFSFLLSGGEPTAREDFHEFCHQLSLNGWQVVTMSNMIKFADPVYMKECFNVGLLKNGTLHVDFSMQHPSNYSGEVVAKKYHALANLEKFGIKANCIQFSIASLDELDFIRTFYNDTKHLYHHMRIRTLFGNWKDTSKKIYLSQLVERFKHVFGDLTPTKTKWPESSNIYSIYMGMEGNNISLSSGPTVDNVDLLSARRPTFSMALDDKYYSFPVAQIISEGIQKGWYNGFKLEGANVDIEEK